MKSNNDNKLAHRIKANSIINNPNKFHNFMINEKKCMSKKQKEEWENCYFALCLLVPEKQLLELINIFGGLDVVKKSKEHINALSRLFCVEPHIIITRIDLIEQKSNEDSKNNKKHKKTIR